MDPSGRLEDDRSTLVLHRSVAATQREIWACLTRPKLLAKWYGSWTGSPRDGFVTVQMSQEQGSPPVRHRILTAQPPTVLTVCSDTGNEEWLLNVRLSHDHGRTQITLRQESFDPESLPSIAPGWEWYLDRLVATLLDTTVPTLDDFERDYLTLADAYLAMIE
ncbi:Activator of Hsp90 ATPase homolog 1-like protein [Propionibacterium cyclohexanicum]|uniref:Activator of Hsp90 ATPase homolog 1-like protein n=1 Tax=Propionibacterium cyclohexanicum TaxID=64702 RepID=A0A1H9Q0H9_9ACTN|nr:SRPBCC domain-containing protein [Propionibacterium cyclohexanicum]SER53902.1 Activator of Hsp90 ATPase homolog 1-like protein [Propionibacterium cyclohexanicum]